ncbi:leucine-rich repeat protein, partial [Christensenellaceae bacterium OttesenSCG-928-L17]|nr:leucine-rich repeat protein [Christensenellaceae bacterium OttesenSCG-928-L17]
ALTGELPVDGGTFGMGLTWGVYDNGDNTYTLKIDGESNIPSGNNNYKFREWGAYADNITDLVIGSGITKIGSQAFYGMPALKNVSVETDALTGASAMEIIETSAFYTCVSLENVTIPASVALIDSNAFYGCTGLTNLTFAVDADGNSALTTIGAYAFYGCKSLAGELVIPVSVKKIGNYAFQNCTSLTGVTFEVDETTKTSALTTIGFAAFSGCTSLAGELTIPAGVDAIEANAFSHCAGLTNVTFAVDAEGNNALRIIGSYAFYYCTALAGDIKIPAGVSAVEGGAFSYTGIESLEFLLDENGESSLTNIGMSAFNMCSALTGKLVIPGSVAQLGSNAFYGCTGLTGVEFAADAQGNTALLSIGTYAFYGCTGLTGELEIPAGVTTIGNNAFYNCAGLTGEFKIPASVKYLSSAVFYNCTGLTGLTFELDDQGNSDLLEIGSSAFYGCTGLRGDLVIPHGVKTISQHAFSGCAELSGKLVIPATVKTMGSSAFKSCRGFTSLVFEVYEDTGKSDLTGLPSEAFASCYGLTGELVLPEGMISIGENAFNYCTGLSGELVIPSTVVTINNYAFRNCSSITGLSVAQNEEGASSLTSIWAYAFRGCGKLETVELPASIATVSSGAFQDCYELRELVFLVDDDQKSKLGTIGTSAFVGTKVTEVIFPSSSSAKGITIMANAFDKCAELTTLDLGDSVVSIGNYAFRKCPKLAGDLVIPGSVNTVEMGAFQECPNLTSVVVEEGVQIIRSNAFQRNFGLTHATIAGSVNRLESGLFSECNSLREVIIHDGEAPRIMSAGVLLDCTSLTYVKIGEGITSIGQRVFENDRALTELLLPSTLEVIDSTAFKNCRSLQKINLPKNLTTINKDAFALCANLSHVRYEVEGALSVDSTAVPSALSFDVTIASNIETLSSTAVDVFKHAKNVYFEGPTTLTIESGAFAGLQYPLSTLSGDVYVDEFGVVYRLHGNGTASIAYCPPGIETYVVPATILAGETTYTVTAVNGYAFNLASNLASITFAAPENILELAFGAFANCKTLTSVNGATSVAGAAASFTNAGVVIGDRAFYNTGLTEQQSIGNIEDRLSYSYPTPEAESRRNLYVALGVGKTTVKDEQKIYHQLTGDSLALQIAADGDHAENVYFRVYVEYSDASFLLNPNKPFYYDPESGERIEVTVAESDLPGIYYIEFQLSAGQTASFVLSMIYPSPTSGGGAVNVWGEILTADARDALSTGVHLPNETDGRYLRGEWETQETIFEAYKLGGGARSLVGDGTESGLATLGGNFTYNLNSLVKTPSDPTYGKDYVKSVDYVDTMTLPAGMYWADDLLQAIANKTYVVKQSDNKFSFFIERDGALVEAIYLFFGESEQGALANARLELDADGKLLAKWTVVNAREDMEVSTAYVAFTIQNAAGIYVDLDEGVYNIEEEQIIHNVIDTTVHYAHAEDAQSSASADYIVNVPTEKLSITKTPMDTSIGYSNKPVSEGAYYGYVLSVKNPGALPTSAGKKVEDSLRNVFYIKADDMQRMFDEEFGKMLTIEIAYALLYESLDLGTATGIDGQTEIKLTPENANGGTVLADSARIKLAYNSTREHLTMTVTNGGDTRNGTYTIGSGEGHDYASIQDALDAMGFVVQYMTTYKTSWDLTSWKVDEEGNPKEALRIYGGGVKEFNVHSSFKNVFQYIRNMNLKGSNGLGDYEEVYRRYTSSYDNQGRLSYGPDNKWESSTSNRYVQRELTITKGASVNGNTVTSASRDLLTLGSVVDYSVHIAKYLSDKHTNVPLIDDLSGAQVLLVPVAKNQNAAWAAGLSIHTDTDGVEYYMLNEPGEYNGVYVGQLDGEDCYAHSVTVEKSGSSLNTKVCWYLPEIAAEAHTKTVTYKTLLWVENFGGSGGETYRISNTAWLNDRVGDRLYENTMYELLIHSEDKHIVVANPGEDTEELDEDDFTVISKNDTVVYRLSVRNPNVVPLVFGKDSLHDILPATYGVFDWDESNVSIHYQINSDVDGRSELTNTGSTHPWEITPVENSTRGEFRIDWTEPTTIPARSTLYFYVYLKFPGEDADDTWGQYCTKTSSVMNIFKVLGREATVTHELQQPARVYLQKGVHTVMYEAPSSGSRYCAKEGRETYSESDAFHRVVQYQATLYNAGNTRVYLTELHDILPEGFVFRGVSPGLLPANETVETSVGYATATSVASIYSKAMGEVADVNNENVEYPGFIVSVVVNGRNVAFKFSAGGSQGDPALGYDPTEELYYLKPGQAISFAYACNVASNVVLPEYATNTIAMPYYDLNGAGVSMAEGVTVQAEVNDFITGRNDGDCELWSNTTAEQNGFVKENTMQWLSSDVTLKKEYIIPGITKTARAYSSAGSTAELPYSNGVYPQDTVHWEMYITNHGDSPMIDYSIIETMQAPYVFTGPVNFNLFDGAGRQVSSTKYTPGGYLFEITRDKQNLDSVVVKYAVNSYQLGQKEITRGTEADAVATTFNTYLDVNKTTVSIPITLRFYVDEKGNEVMEMQLKDARASVPEQHSLRLQLSTMNPTTTQQYTVFTNRTVVKPTQSYDAFLVSQGLNLTDENGQNMGILGSAPINVIVGNATSSVKHVTEKDANGDFTENTAASSDTRNYIVLGDKESVFTYQLKVHNDTADESDAIRKLIFIDNLPEEDDHATFATDDPRGSKFKVSFPKVGSAYEPNFRVVVSKKVDEDYVDTVLGAADYTVEYSDKTEFAADDWNGTSNVGWYSEPTDTTRSFRVVILDDTKLKMPAEAYITVAFDAVVDGDASAGETAWNSFGYRYKRFSSEIELEAAPLKVGVRINSAPNLRKSLIDSGRDAYAVTEDTTFRFLIHEGKALAAADYASAAALETALGENKVTFVDVKVPKGSTISDMLPLEELFAYERNGNEWEATTNAWNWRNATQYTILEVEVPEHYHYVSMNNRSGATYTFTYQSDTNIVLTALNQNEDYGLVVLKEDEGGEKKLAGAVFGLYSPEEARQMNSEAYQAVFDTYGVTPAIELTVEDVTYYLTNVQATDDDGKATWEKLDQDSYYVVELKAPDGYMLDDTPQKVTRVGGYYEMTVVNYTMVELPESG